MWIMDGHRWAAPETTAYRAVRSFSQPEVVRRLRTAFVPYAGDKWYLNRQSDGDSKFFRDVARREGKRNDDGTGLGTLRDYRTGRSLPMTISTRHRAYNDAAETGRLQAKKMPQQKTAVVTACRCHCRRRSAICSPPARRWAYFKCLLRIPLPPPPGRRWTNRRRAVTICG